MYRVLIIDDDARAAEAVRDALFACCDKKLIELSYAASPADFLEQKLNAVPFDLVFADIMLGDGDAGDAGEGAGTTTPAGAASAPAASVAPNGIDFVRRYFPAASGAQVIFITGYVEYCQKVYEADHIYFLLKPFSQDDFARAFDKARANLRLRSRNRLSFTVGSEIVTLPVSQIVYIESDRRRAIIHTTSDTHATYATLGKLLELLPDCFVQCHKSFLVNMNYVDRMEPTALELLGCKTKIPVSQSKRKETRAQLAKFLRPA